MVRRTDRPAMTIAVDFGRKATKQTRPFGQISYGACFGIDNLNMTIFSMSHDHNVFHAMPCQVKSDSKSLSLKLMGQSPLVLVCLIRDMVSNDGPRLILTL